MESYFQEDMRYDGTFLRAATRLMLLSLATMVLSLLSLYFAPLFISSFISATLYGFLCFFEWRLKIFSPITRLMTFFYVSLSFARFFTTDLAWSAYAAPLIYTILAFVVFCFLAVGRPFTIYYSKGAGFYPLHKKMSLLWGSLHAMAALASITLMPNVAFLFVPMALMLIGAVGTLWLNFVSMGKVYGRQKIFNVGRFRFEEVQTEAQRELFYSTIADAYSSDLQRAAGPGHRVDKNSIKDRHRSSDEARRGYTIPFLAYLGSQPIGGICLFIDHPELGLSIESEANLSLDNFRDKGPVVEIGRLGILTPYRLDRSVLMGLFKCMIEAAVERKVYTILNDCFSFQVKLYSKIGFTPIQEEAYGGGSTGLDIKALPMAMNLARMIRLEEQNTVGREVRDMLQPYVVERFFKILAIKEIFNEVFLLRMFDGKNQLNCSKKVER